MPSHYAHYYFGKEVIRVMPGDVKDIINTSRFCVKAYILGLQGPDILAFYRPYILNNRLNREGSRIHHNSGSDFFSEAARRLKKDAGPEQYSYIFGCLAHYMLDSACHPIVTQYMAETGLTHAKIEREFDNYVLKICRKSPKGLDLGPILPEDPRLGKLIAPFYRKVSPKEIIESVHSMSRILSLMGSKNPRVRTAGYRILSAVPSEAVRSHRDMIVQDQECREALKSSVRLFDALNKSVMDTSVELDHLMDSILIGAPASERLQPDYLGIVHPE